jgi:glyoxylase-like metal-dependent hydrolase (beta-lactamase superfamily II)
MYRIYPLVYGHIEEPEPRIFYLGDCSKTIKLVNMFFLVKGPGVTALVDTGVSKADGDKFNPFMGQSPQEDPVALLEAHGVTAEGVTHVIATHLHWDHLSPVAALFTNAKVYAHPDEIKMALDPPYPWFGQFIYTDVVKSLSGTGRLVETPDGTEIIPGIRTLWTGGHTFGSQGVVIDTAAGRVCLSGDVCFTYRNLDENLPGGFNSNLVECFDGLQKVRKSADTVVPSHDPLVAQRYPDGIG